MTKPHIDSPALGPSWRTWWTFGFSVWTGLALLMVLQSAMAFIYRGIPFSWTTMIVMRLFDWYTCALFIPALVWLARHFPIGGSSITRNVVIQLASTVVFVLLKYALVLPFAKLAPRGGGPDATFVGLLAGNAIVELTILWCAVAAIRAIDVYLQLRRQENQSMVLSEQLTSARLSALSAQLRPHFLFNTLNSITALIRRDPEGAERMVMQLADLLNASLRHREASQIRLDDELRVLDQYLAIMQVRFGSRLTVDQHIESEAMDVLVPTLFLQPLVENALEHGIAERPGPGTLAVEATLRHEMLCVVVSDDGPGVSSSIETGDPGIGLANTKARLEALYGSRASLTVSPRAGGGTSVTICLPAQRTP